MENINATISKCGKECLSVSWLLTFWCNYRCSYCLQMGKDKITTPDYETIKQRASDIHRLMENYNDSWFANLSGGEISFLNLIELTDILYTPKLKEIHITTNLSNKKEVYKNWLEHCKNKYNLKATIRASLHDDHVKDFEAFVKKVSEISKDIIIQFTVNKQNMDKVEGLKKLFEKYNTKYTFEIDRSSPMEIILPKDPVTYNKNYLVYYKNGDIISTTKDEICREVTPLGEMVGVRSRSFICYKKSIAIGPDGIVSYYNCNKERLGNIKDLKKINLYPIICIRDRCTLCTCISISRNKQILKENFPELKDI